MTLLERVLSTDLQFLKGVGPQFSKRLKALGLKTFWDCLSYLPSHYDIYPFAPLGQRIGQKVSVQVEILCQSPQRKTWCWVGKTVEGGELVEIVFFHRPYLALPVGSRWIIQGTVSLKGGYFQMIHPEAIREKILPHQTMVARYGLTQGVTHQKLTSLIERVWSQLTDPPEWVRPEIRQRYAWPSWRQALWQAHHDGPEMHSPWRERLAFDELMAQQIAFLKESRQYQQLLSPVCPLDTPLLMTFLQRFGHSLTASQQQAWQAIQEDLQKVSPMMRLVHGDVGSGKTILAFLSMIQVAAAGYQACLLAPTEILARQHYENLSRLVEGMPFTIDLVLGKQKKDAELREATLVIGTHAVFQERITFARLGIVVVDEQQRFGVAQRLKLAQKGQAPHLLFMSATPIPRTFEMALWSHLDVSRLTEKPYSVPVTSYVTPIENITTLEERLARCLHRGERIYWVCPLIDAAEKREGSVLFRAERLEKRFPGKVGMLHGKMTTEEKMTAVERFRAGSHPLLVSTTVIEIGVHVDEATTMVIEGSERFGLAQLHQLRGRVGRACQPGHCFFLYNRPLSAVARERLVILRQCDDGFEIAEKDWKLRGGGEFLGTQQSGAPQYRFADLAAHHALLPLAKQEAESLLADGPKDVVDFLLGLFAYQEGISLAG